MHVHHEEIIVIWMLATQLLPQLGYCRQVLEIFILTELTGYKLLQSKPFKFVKAREAACAVLDICSFSNMLTFQHKVWKMRGTCRRILRTVSQTEEVETTKTLSSWVYTFFYKSPCRTVNPCCLHLFNHPLLNLASSHALDFLFWQKVVQTQ